MKMNPLTQRLVIRGLESKIESITNSGRRQESDAWARGLPYTTAQLARSRCNLKRMIRKRIARLESELLGVEG